MQVKCYDCGKLVSAGEAVKQKEGGGNLGGGGYRGKSGWGAGAGSWKSEGRSYWLCIECDRRRVEKKRFWQWVTIGIFVGILLLLGLIYLIAVATPR
ncbi:MAG: hypothetical protein I3273_00370 [Candidatus Moeniiplasma glomeromycotorum]|nr:hypothetical protein [Candidatus Moeniiplasma glomeromycotorum]MCE8167417.1 hypothetical protein [Candidatus Moeniiplasma glomeromycotorum]MCE8168569.1 hypothetical protein [Candidatus Moeniiplasma glomeromycotorum]